jgi:hypothetical protein
MHIARTFVVCAELATALLLPGVFAGVAGAQIPRTLSYQGVLADSTGALRPDGNYSFTFRLYLDGSGGSAIWTESKTLTLTNGLFHTVLGDQTPIGPSVAFDKPYWLGIQVGGSGEMSPRTPLSSVGYSFSSISSIWADSALSVRDSSIFSTKIARDQVVRSLGGIKDDVAIEVAAGATLLKSGRGDSVTLGPVVRGLNGFLGNVTLQGEGGTTVTSSDNTITIGTLTAPGMGIQEIQNTDGTLSITDAIGPTTTVNMALPLQFEDAITDAPVLDVLNSGPGMAGMFHTGDNGTALAAFGPGLGIWCSASGNGTGSYFESYQNGALLAYANRGGVATFWSDETGGVHTLKVFAGPGGEAAHIDGNVSIGGMGSNPNPTLDVTAGSGTDAAFFHGDVFVDGDLRVYGTMYDSLGFRPLSLKIDHPLDPATKYLVHSSVASPDMMNVYNGDVVLDASGEAWVDLPDYLEALNRDFRYQLTAVGAPGPNLYLADKVANHRFRIAGGTPGLEVSWQLTGIRKDPWAEANRIVVEPEKAAVDRGRYLHPDLYGKPAELAIGWKQAPPRPSLAPTEQLERAKAIQAEFRARAARPAGGK